ncbi:MAG: amino acid ABC transporter substrate-binding protein [Marinobacter sp.]|uniref:amino acid ABC transporter substrate-binding protein n=1 Tax=Marinobacter sp. TaxID=50741 RepID=UPI00299E6CA2|nr:amino acid ABC transporter substrate-binding protein [Marinobacter sp.]MDX1634002.1 amino acid ABC transporter substrate-binding protein [Marinobacter sp.]
MAPLRLLAISVMIFLAQPLQAEDLVIFGPDPPAASEPDGKGRDSEIVGTVLSYCGYTVEFRLMPFGRHIRNFSETTVADGVMTVPLNATVAGASSQAYIWYQNGAATLRSRDLNIASVEDLFGLRLVTFQNGISILELEDFVDRFATITEISNQRVHSHLLFLGRVDAVLADGLILAEINRRLETEDRAIFKGADLDEPLDFAPIFQPTPYKMVFRNSRHREDFERCYRQLDSLGHIHEINHRHVGKYRDSIGYRYLGY